MSWAVGGPDDYGRWIGYGVPATCDHPGCGASIDRGLAFACGGGITESVPNCGMFFCSRHLRFFKEDDSNGGAFVCVRCAHDEESFEPTPDTVEWLRHLLSDDSWQQWRDERPARVEEITADLASRQETP